MAHTGPNWNDSQRLKSGGWPQSGVIFASCAPDWGLGAVGSSGPGPTPNSTGRRLVLPPTSRAGPPPRAVKLSSRDRRIQDLEDPGSAIDAKSHNFPTHRDQNFPEDLLAVAALQSIHDEPSFHCPKTSSIFISVHDQSGALPVEIQGSHKICSEFFFFVKSSVNS